jgi:hypothetical protein
MYANLYVFILKYILIIYKIICTLIHLDKIDCDLKRKGKTTKNLMKSDWLHLHKTAVKKNELLLYLVKHKTVKTY